MAEILHRIGVVAPVDDVYEAVATSEGVAAWWTLETTGTSEVGNVLELRFGEFGGFDLEVTKLDPAGRVTWRVVGGPDEWIGTDIDWQLEQVGTYTIVRFEHSGWREPVEFMAHCTTKWATFLLSLKELVETGAGRPAPHELRISDWH